MNKKWARENKEKVNKLKRKYYWKDVDKKRLQNKAWRLKNKDKIKKQRDSLSLKEKEKTKEQQKVYYKKNKANLREKAKKYYYKNRNEILQKESIISKKNSEKLTDRYIKNLLIKGSVLSSSDIPQWLIDAKRDEIKLQRIVKARGRDTWLK